MSIRASIDIGSNSILLLLANVSEDKIQILENCSHVTGLGRDLDKKHEFIPIAMEESLAVLETYADLCKKHHFDPAKAVVTATEASRVAKNAKEFFFEVKEKTGFSVTTISGEAEAYYSTMGILFDEKITDEVITIMDIGGASTELIQVNTKGKKILEAFSMPLGAVRLNNWRLEGNLESSLAQAIGPYQERINQIKSQRLYCVAGTMTSIGNIHLGNKDFIENEVNGLSMKYSELKSLHGKVKDINPDDILKGFPFLGKRSKTIDSGFIVAKTIMELLEVKDIYISTYGLRYGTLLEGEIKDEFIVKRF